MQKAKYAIIIVGLLLIASLVTVSAAYSKSLKLAPPFTCPAQTGTCTAGKCTEDLGVPPINACEWDCVASAYTAGDECGTNMCNGADCDQG